MTQEQLLGYCAGFMDGEGTIIVGKSQQAKRNFPSYGLAIKVAQKEQEPLRLLQSLFGGTIYTTTRKGIRMQPVRRYIRHLKTTGGLKASWLTSPANTRSRLHTIWSTPSVPQGRR